MISAASRLSKVAYFSLLVAHPVCAPPPGTIDSRLARIVDLFWTRHVAVTAFAAKWRRLHETSGFTALRHWSRPSMALTPEVGHEIRVEAKQQGFRLTGRWIST